LVQIIYKLQRFAPYYLQLGSLYANKPVSFGAFPSTENRETTVEDRLLPRLIPGNRSRAQHWAHFKWHP